MLISKDMMSLMFVNQGFSLDGESNRTLNPSLRHMMQLATCNQATGRRILGERSSSVPEVQQEGICPSIRGNDEPAGRRWKPGRQYRIKLTVALISRGSRVVP
jgi:hypothetical protein